MEGFVIIGNDKIKNVIIGVSGWRRVKGKVIGEV